MSVSMGGIFSFFDWAFGEGKTCYMLILGLDASGKTTLLNRLKTNENTVTIPTIGFNSETISYGRLKFTMMDIGGQAKLRNMWHHYFENCNAVVFVVDSNDQARMKEAKEEVWKLLKHPMLQDIPFLFFANKQDLPNALRTTAVQNKLDLLMIRGREYKIIGSCATEGRGIDEGFQWLSNNV